MKKKAQIKFGETFGVIIIVYLIIMVGMIWYNNINIKTINEMNQNNQKDMAFEKYYYITNSQFLHISQQGDVDQEFDLTSLKIFANYSKTPQGEEYIRKQLGESTITIELLNKNLNSKQNLTIYNKTPAKTTNKEQFKTLIPVIDPINKTTDIAILTVIVYT